MGSQQPFLFLVDFKSSVLSVGIERLVVHIRAGLSLELVLMLWSLGAAAATDARPKR